MAGPLMSKDEEERMNKSFRSGIAHAGWLHKLVGKTPLDVHWKKYWVSWGWARERDGSGVAPMWLVARLTAGPGKLPSAAVQHGAIEAAQQAAHGSTTARAGMQLDT